MKIKYQYDKDVKKVVDSLKDKLNKENYALTDLDYFNWIINYLTQLDENAKKGIDEEIEEPSMAMFSTEFKKNIGYRNFELDVRMGGDFPLFTECGGMGTFTYDDTIYYVVPTPVRAYYDHLFYVDASAIDIVKAVKDRLETNTTHKFEVEDTEQTVEEFIYDNYYYEYDSNEMNQQQYADAATYAQAKLNEIKDDEEHPYHYLADYFNEHVYLIEFDFENIRAMDFVIPVKDSNKVTKPEFKSNDINSDISISTDSIIPLDTLIKVAKLTSGEEYDKIVKVLNNTNIEMYDLKLFSASANQYITRLDNGSFEVKIPIREEWKGKDLVAYYVDDDNKVEEYEVTVKNDYAVFTTNHFSIYTLAEKQISDGKIEEEKNPETYDGVMLWIVLGIVSIIGIVGTIRYGKKYFKKDL